MISKGVVPRKSQNGFTGQIRASQGHMGEGYDRKNDYHRGQTVEDADICLDSETLPSVFRAGYGQGYAQVIEGISKDELPSEGRDRGGKGGGSV